MQSETLSEHLCKICGIEPQYWCSYHDTICPIQDAGKFNPTCPKQAVTKECDARSSRMQYVNFETNNSNFVKLLEIFHRNGYYIQDMRFRIISISQSSCIEKEGFVVYFLKYLIKQLEDTNISEVVREDLKQLIRREQWDF